MLGERIKKMRTAAGFSQATLAKSIWKIMKDKGLYFRQGVCDNKFV